MPVPSWARHPLDTDAKRPRGPLNSGIPGPVHCSYCANDQHRDGGRQGASRDPRRVPPVTATGQWRRSMPMCTESSGRPQAWSGSRSRTARSRKTQPRGFLSHPSRNHCPSEPSWTRTSSVRTSATRVACPAPSTSTPQHSRPCSPPTRLSSRATCRSTSLCRGPPAWRCSSSSKWCVRRTAESVFFSETCVDLKV